MPEIESLKRVPCHCGGKAILRKRNDGYYDVFCSECTITTVCYKTAEAAVHNWNFTMAEKTAKVIDVGGEYVCGHCGMCMEGTWKYCPDCGAELEWELYG